MGSCCVNQELTEEDIQFLKAHTRFDIDEQTIRDWYADFHQDCPNGKLTPTTFCEMHKRFFPAGDAEKFCENVFSTFDSGKSGTIDFKLANKICYYPHRCQDDLHQLPNFELGILAGN